MNKLNGLITVVLSCSIILTACGKSDNSYNSGAAMDADYAYSDSFSAIAGVTNGAAEQGYNTKSNSLDYAVSAETEYVDEAGVSNEVIGNTENGTLTGMSQDIRREMLIYTCNMSIDVLTFDDSVASFKEQVENFGGFVERESYSDGGRAYQWYDENVEKWQKYSATIRIPSNKYNEFCNTVGTIGDLRSKEANVENVSQEYYDLKTELEIYEAKEQRYINMLSTIQEDEYAIAVESELTNIQIEIAKIKTRMNTISTDVAYSTIFVNINEVKEYRAEPVQQDTFIQRLCNTLSETGTGFVMFLEDLLFFVIEVFPYAVIIGLIVFVVVRVHKKRVKGQIKLGKNKVETISNEPAKKDNKE